MKDASQVHMHRLFGGLTLVPFFAEQSGNTEQTISKHCWVSKLNHVLRYVDCSEAKLARGVPHRALPLVGLDEVRDTTLALRSASLEIRGNGIHGVEGEGALAENDPHGLFPHRLRHLEYIEPTRSDTRIEAVFAACVTLALRGG